MADNKCPDCGRQFPKNHTRCLPCDELKYQAELENPPVSPLNNVGFSQSLAEIAENRKARKDQMKEAQLDSAFAWGTAIGGNDIQLDFSHEEVLDVWAWSDVHSINPNTSSKASRAFGDRSGRYKLYVGQSQWALVDESARKILGKGSMMNAEFRQKSANINGANFLFEVDGGAIQIKYAGAGYWLKGEGHKASARQMNLVGRLDTTVSEGDFAIQSQETISIETVFLGGAGIPMQTYEKSSLVISRKGFVIGQGGSSIWSKSFEGLIGVQVSGEGLLQSGGGWIGGGFGVSGALKGALFASVMNSLTTRTHNDCYFRFVYPGVEGTFQVLSHTPRNLEIALSGVKNWIETRGLNFSQAPQLNQGLTTVEQLERLHQLVEKGILSKLEFEKEKAKILGLS